MKPGLTRRITRSAAASSASICPVEVLARPEHPVMPDVNQAFALERTQMYEEALLQLLVGVRV
jgi:hypothetical protein